MSAPVCWACSCAQASDEEHFDRATVVFTGTATDRSETSGQQRWTFDVESVQKGGAAPELRVLTGVEGNTCAPSFREGGRYQVFARRNADGRLETSICDGTRSLDGEGDGEPGSGQRGEIFEGTVTPQPSVSPTPGVEGRSREELIAQGSTSRAVAEAAQDTARRNRYRRYALIGGAMAITAAALWLVARRVRRRSGA